VGRSVARCVLEFSNACVTRFLKGLSEAFSCPVALYPATLAAERLSFRKVNRRTGHRLKHKRVDTVTGQADDSSNKGRGYKIGETKFLMVDDRDLEHARRMAAKRCRTCRHRPFPTRVPPRTRATLLGETLVELRAQSPIRTDAMITAFCIGSL
jgi:hypothetical protein